MTISRVSARSARQRRPGNDRPAADPDTGSTVDDRKTRARDERDDCERWEPPVGSGERETPLLRPANKVNAHRTCIVQITVSGNRRAFATGP